MENTVLRLAEKAIGDAISKELVGYGKPLGKYVDSVIEKHKDELISLLDTEFTNILTAKSFRDALKTALNDKLARVLISKYGGELEKQVNQLKANPETRAKITLAISKVINDA